MRLIASLHEQKMNFGVNERIWQRKIMELSIDNQGKWLYICVVLMYQHKGVSPEPFEQRPLSRIPGLGIRSPRREKEVERLPFLFSLSP